MDELRAWAGCKAWWGNVCAESAAVLQLWLSGVMGALRARLGYKAWKGDGRDECATGLGCAVFNCAVHRRGLSACAGDWILGPCPGERVWRLPPYVKKADATDPVGCGCGALNVHPSWGVDSWLATLPQGCTGRSHRSSGAWIWGSKCASLPWGVDRGVATLPAAHNARSYLECERGARHHVAEARHARLQAQSVLSAQLQSNAHAASHPLPLSLSLMKSNHLTKLNQCVHALA